MQVQTMSTLGMSFRSRQAVAETQAQLAERQGEQSSGKKADVAGELGIRAARLVAMRNGYQEAQEYLASNELIASRLEIAQSALTNATESVETFISTLIAGLNSETGASLVQQAARDLVDKLRGALNSGNGSRFLFSGTATDMPSVQPADQVNGGSGVSPLQVMQNVIAAKPPVVDSATLADLLNGPDGIAAVFDDSHGVAGHRYSETFYNGSAVDVTAKVDVTLEIQAGMRADQGGIRLAMQTAFTLAAIDRTTMPPPQYRELMERGLRDLQAGLGEIRAGQAALGLSEQSVERAQGRHRLVSEVLTRQVNALESADPYETAVRLSSLTSQLEATFAITARVGWLSLINFL